MQRKLGEMDATVGEFNSAEQELAKDDIAKVKAMIEGCEKKEDLENMTSEINSIKSKICMAIVEKTEKLLKQNPKLMNKMLQRKLKRLIFSLKSTVLMLMIKKISTFFN